METPQSRRLISQGRFETKIAIFDKNQCSKNELRESCL